MYIVSIFLLCKYLWYIPSYHLIERLANIKVGFLPFSLMIFRDTGLDQLVNLTNPNQMLNIRIGSGTRFCLGERHCNLIFVGSGICNFKTRQPVTKSSFSLPSSPFSEKLNLSYSCPKFKIKQIIKE